MGILDDDRRQAAHAKYHGAVKPTENNTVQFIGKVVNGFMNAVAGIAIGYAIVLSNTPEARVNFQKIAGPDISAPEVTTSLRPILRPTPKQP